MKQVSFGLLALSAAVLVACSSGGGGGTVVPQPFQNFGSHRHRPMHAIVYLRIPAHRHRHGRRRMHPEYVSPGTASITFAVQPIAGSGPAPTPLPLQTFNTTVPPCKKIKGSGGVLLCQFDVSVMPGSDSFVVNTYSLKNGGGKVLSTYSSGSTVIPTPDPKGNSAPLAFTLEGVIDHVVLQFPNSVVPADTQGQVGAIPVGVATSAPLNVTPYDAANYHILSQVPAKGTPVPYSAPITLTVAPAGAGMTLGNASGSGNSVTISNPNDLAVNVNYSGAFTASRGSVSSTQSFSIAATGTTLALRARKIDVRAPRAATPAPNAAGIALSGNAIPGGTFTTTLTTPVPLGLVSIGATGNMAFFADGYAPGFVLNSILGTANGGVPGNSGTFVGNIAGENFADSLGNLWVYDQATNQIDCFAQGSLTTPAGSIPASTIIYPGGSFYGFSGFAQDSSNDLWFTLYGAQPSAGYFETIGYVPLNATSCTSPVPVIYQALPADFIYTTSLAAVPGTGSIVVGNYDSTLGSPSILVAATAAPTPNVSTVPLAAGTFPEEMFGGPSTAYAFVSGNSQTFGSVSPAGAYSTISTYPVELGSFLGNTQSTGTSAAGFLGTTAYNSSYSAIDGGAYVTLLNPADNNPSSNFEALSVAKQCNGVAFDAQDTAWTFCLNASGTLQFYHLVPTSTWSVLPGTVIPVQLYGSLPPYTGTAYVGVLDAFGSSNGPFTLKNYDASRVSGVTPAGNRGMVLTLSVPNTGFYSTSADLVDKNGRSVTVTFDIEGIYYAGAPPRPAARAHARRGYAPISRN